MKKDNIQLLTVLYEQLQYGLEGIRAEFPEVIYNLSAVKNYSSNGLSFGPIWSNEDPRISDYDRCLPILHEMDLTKPITVDGETFVPAIYLARFVDNGYDHEDSRAEIHPNKIIVSTEKCDDVQDVHFWFRDGELFSISIQSFEHISLKTWFKIESKLNEWHMNWRNLPESDYIKVSSLPKSPYA